jgi:hypothetical protein
VDPNDAEVYVDGYFAGHVDDFDNLVQRLHVAPGGHDIVIYLDGYRSLAYSMYFGPFSDQGINDRMVPLAPGEPADPRPEPAPYELPAEAPDARPSGVRRDRAVRLTGDRRAATGRDHHGRWRAVDDDR